jgi:hypothetical protein
VARVAAAADATARKQQAKNLVIERMTEQPLDFFCFCLLVFLFSINRFIIIKKIII